jgi:2,4-dienoyl-CoA reductase-like NADH-dependent reductase (Old Yellow Enzyme family)
LADLSILFEPFQLGSLTLPNRIVMAPMTRMMAPDSIPDDNIAGYYRRRAEGGTGLIITEGTTVATDVAGGLPGAPYFHGASLQGWANVVDAVHEANGIIFPQLWHLGMQRFPPTTDRPDLESAGPSGLLAPGKQKSAPMTDEAIADTIEAFIQAVVDAKEMGCDGVELHGAHGYLIDQFFWEGTNKRDDKWGGDIVGRTRFATEILRGARKRVGDDFPIIMRCSQWKGGDFDAKLANTPDEFGAFLAPMVDAGVTAFHCSTRRFWQPEFEGSPLNLAGWAKKLTGLPTISVGSVGLNGEYSAATRDATAEFAMDTLDRLVEMMERGDFDLIGVGRALLANPAWANLVRDGRFEALEPYSAEVMETLN